MIEHRSPDSQQNDPRADLTKKIWGMAVGMLGICIPLSPATGSGPMIPIFVLMAAAAGTIGIWGGKMGASRSLGSDAAALDSASKKQIQELENRLAALESITNFEHHLLEKKYPNAAPVPVAPVAVAPVAPAFSLDNASGGVMSDTPNAAASPSVAQPFRQSG